MSYTLSRKPTTSPGDLEYVARTRNVDPMSVPVSLALFCTIAGLWVTGYAVLALVATGLLFSTGYTALATEESITLHPTLSLSLTTSRLLLYTFTLPFVPSPPTSLPSSYSIARHVRTIQLDEVEKVVINEGLEGAKGKHYLGVLVRRNGGERNTEVAFPGTLPKLEDLKRVLSDLQPLLPEGK